MDGWVYGWVYGWVDGWVNGLADGTSIKSRVVGLPVPQLPLAGGVDGVLQ